MPRDHLHRRGRLRRKENARRYRFPFAVDEEMAPWDFLRCKETETLVDEALRCVMAPPSRSKTSKSSSWDSYRREEMEILVEGDECMTAPPSRSKTMTSLIPLRREKVETRIEVLVATMMSPFRSNASSSWNFLCREETEMLFDERFDEI